MLTLNLPSCGIRIKFDKMWSVTKLTEGKDEVLFRDGEYPNHQLAAFITFFPSMWGVATALANKVNLKLEPDAPYNFPFELPAGMSWSTMYAHVPATRPYGRTLSYNDGYNDWTMDGVLSLFQYMSLQAEDSEAARYIMGALHQKYTADHFFYLAAAKTGHCVRCDLSSMKWEAYDGTPEGLPTVSTVGITTYITEGDKAPDLSQLIIGVNLLVSCVGIDYSTEMLRDAPEALFQGVPFSTDMEQALPLTTNANRLFYMLNTDRDIPVQEEQAPTLEKAELPTVKWERVPTNGVPIETGGGLLVDGGNGEYEMYDVVRWLNDAYEAYATYASQFDNSHLSKLAMQQFLEKFGNVRADVSPSKPSTSIPLQLEAGPVTYAWDDALWYPILGSQRLYPEQYDSFRYVDKKVTMSTAMWTQLLKTLLDQFNGPCPGLAALYYMTADLPDEESAYEGEARIVDHWRMQEAIFHKGEWHIREATPYTNEALMTDTGLAIEVTGTGSISSKELVQMLIGAHAQAMQLLENRFEVIDDMCAETAFGTYQLLHECMPAAMLDIRQAPMSGVIGDIVSPVVLYKDKQRLSNTATGWHFNSVAHDRTKKLGKVGDYTIGYEPGIFPWDRDVAKVIKDALELTLDYNSPAVVAAIELENAQ